MPLMAMVCMVCMNVFAHVCPLIYYVTTCSSMRYGNMSYLPITFEHVTKHVFFKDTILFFNLLQNIGHAR